MKRQPNKSTEATAGKSSPSNQSQAPAVPHLYRSAKMKISFALLAALLGVCACSSIPEAMSVAGFYTNTVQMDEPWRCLTLENDGTYAAEVHRTTIILEGTDGIERDYGKWSIIDDKIQLQSAMIDPCVLQITKIGGTWIIDWDGFIYSKKSQPNQRPEGTPGSESYPSAESAPGVADQL